MIEIPILYAKAFVLAIPPFATAGFAYLAIREDKLKPIRDYGLTPHLYFILTMVAGLVTVFEIVAGSVFFLPYAIEYVVNTLSKYIVFV